jgi:hypothetical protein
VVSRAAAGVSSVVRLIASQSDRLEVLRVKTLTFENKPFLAYNLEVGEDHTFFVGTTRAWVHNICPLRGSGPAPGMIEVSARAQSLKAFQQMKSGDFIFDPVSNTFVAAGKRLGNAGTHPTMADALGVANRRLVVGGQFSRGPNGEIITNELSGHFGENWTPAIREQFRTFMEQMTGNPVQHAAYR